jgi:transposase
MPGGKTVTSTGRQPRRPRMGSAGWWCAPLKARSGRARPCGGRWIGCVRSGRRRCGTWASARFACVPDARAALAAQLKQCPAWLQVESVLVMQPKHRRPGRPRKDASADHVEWQILPTLSVDEAAVAREARSKAAFLVATNVLDSAQLSNHELIQTYKEQHSVERGFSFLKDPLFLASSVFVRKPERIVALSLVMVLCLLVYRLAEQRLREQLVARGQTVPTQLKQPTDHPTMRWIFQCFEGVSLVTFQSPQGPPHRELANLEHLHQQIATLLGPHCDNFYKVHD